MSVRNIIFNSGEFYHLYNRGNSKQIIFHDKEDMDRLLQLLCIANKTKRFVLKEVTDSVYINKKDSPIIAIGAYCLMPNHFHILATPLVKGGISTFMQKLSTAYAMYYNKKYKRSGSLFEGKFKSSHVNNDNYLKYLFSYIHLNPIKLIDSTWKEKGLKNISKTKDYLRNYHYSSYLDFINGFNDKRDESVIIDPLLFPKYFPNSKSFEKEIIAWLSLKPDNEK